MEKLNICIIFLHTCTYMFILISQNYDDDDFLLLLFVATQSKKQGMSFLVWIAACG